MNLLDGAEALAQVIKAAGGKVEGRKKLQKLIYLAKKKGFAIDHDFRYHYHGVFSADVEHDIRLARAFGLIEETGDPETRQDVSLHSPDLVKERSENPGLKLVHALRGEEARTLEVLSTIVYLKSVGFEEKRLNLKVEELKGHIPKTFHAKAWNLFNIHFVHPSAATETYPNAARS